MKTKNIFSAILMAMLVLAMPFALTSCDGDDQLDTNQFTESVSLLSYGPCPVARGGELRFIGTGLNTVTSITLPGCADVTDITRKSNQEISIIVPKTAQPGLVVLHSSKGDITSKTRLSFTEPVGFAASNAFNPSPVKPGQTLTISGSYLNLVQSIIFADEVEVTDLEHSSADEPMDQWIKVVVPAEAQTGKVIIGFVATGDTLMNKVLSEGELEIVLPSVNAIANLSGKKPGDKIELAGANLDLITKVTVADAEVEFAVKDGKVSFVLPASTPAEAEIAMYPASGVKVTIATIGMTLPTELVATPATELRNGTEITISGNDLDVVETIHFPGVADAADFHIADGAIVVACPEGFVSGEMILTTKSGIQLKLAIETQKPAFESFAADAVPMGSDVTINGANLDLVAKVIYPGDKEGAVLEGGSAAQIVVTMPASGVESGKITLVMANGETAETGELTVNAPEFCYVTEWPELEEDELIHAGDVLGVKVEHADRLTKVEINGEEMAFFLNKEVYVYMNTPNNAKGGAVIKLISEGYGEIEYTYDFKPNTEIENVLFKGVAEVSWNEAVNVPGSVTSTFKVGQVIRINYMAVDRPDGYHQIRMIGTGWSYNPEGSEFYQIAPSGEDTWIVEITEDWIEHFGASGFSLTGYGAVVTKVSVVEFIQLEETIWKGEAEVKWNNAVTFSAADMASWKVGQLLRIYYVATAADYHMVRVINNDWSFNPDGDPLWNTNFDTDGVWELPYNQALVDNLGGKDMSFTGFGCNIVKITLE